MEQKPEDLERVLNEFLASNKDDIKAVEDVNVARYPDGTCCGTITYTEKEKPRRGYAAGGRP